MTVTYKTFNDLATLPITYANGFNVNFVTQNARTANGLPVLDFTGFTKCKDVAVASGNVIILTEEISLSAIIAHNSFYKSREIFHQPRFGIFTERFSPSQGISVVNQSLKRGTPTAFTLSPLNIEENLIEIFYNNLQVQIEPTYPYTVILDKPIKTTDQYRQQFYVVKGSDDLIALKVKTSEGFRYLTLCSDNQLRAVGVVLNDTILNDYYFNFKPKIQTTTNKVTSFLCDDWVTYYLEEDTENQTKNNTVDVKKKFQAPCHLLLTSSLYSMEKNHEMPLDICRLRTNFNATGSPTMVVNV